VRAERGPHRHQQDRRSRDSSRRLPHGGAKYQPTARTPAVGRTRIDRK
jgi:hypothetical protein